MPTPPESAGPRGPEDPNSPTALPELPFIGEPERAAAAVEAPAPSDVGTSETGSSVSKREQQKYPTQKARDALTESYRGLTTKEIQSRIQQDFFEAGNEKIEYHKIDSNDVNSRIVTNGLGLSKYEKALNLRLFDHARRLEWLSTQYSKTLGLAKQQQSKEATAAGVEQADPVAEARKQLDREYSIKHTSIDQYQQANSVEEIARLTAHWVERKYLQAEENEDGTITYDVPASARFDKGRLVAANSIMDMREEALQRLSQTPGQAVLQAPAVTPAPERDEPTALDQLLNLSPLKAEATGDGLKARLNYFKRALTEAGNDTDELEAVMGQAFRQNLLKREDVRDPGSGKIVHTEFKAVSPDIDAWYKATIARYQVLLSHSDPEREAADAEEETNIRHTEKGAGWFKTRAAMFRRKK